MGAYNDKYDSFTPNGESKAADTEQLLSSMRSAFKEPLQTPSEQHLQALQLPNDDSGAEVHPLWMRINQLTVGVYLLREQLAEPDNEIVHFLDNHADEIDTHLQNAARGFELVQLDITERTLCLKHVMAHVSTFEMRLANREFRDCVFQGKERVDEIKTIASAATRTSLIDVSTGIKAMTELITCLDGEWSNTEKDSLPTYEAIRDKADAWCRTLEALSFEGNALNVALAHLCNMVEAMTVKARIASRLAVRQSISVSTGF